MPTPKKPLTERIADKIEAFNNLLIVHIMRIDELLDRMDLPGQNAKNLALIKEYFHNSTNFLQELRPG
jgi:hypothetical protein